MTGWQFYLNSLYPHLLWYNISRDHVETRHPKVTVDRILRGQLSTMTTGVC